MKTENIDNGWNRWWFVILYAAAMAWVESAVVFYLRSMIDRLEPYQPDPFPVIGGFAPVELPREFATLVMLFAVGALAGRTWRSRLGYAAVAFGVWDIFYYVFLKIICGWPHSLLDWDVLFLLPLPWWGPVLAPMCIAFLMVVYGTLLSQFERLPHVSGPNWKVGLASLCGMVLALYVFMVDALHTVGQGKRALVNMLPTHFNWTLFIVALALMAVPIVVASRQIMGQRQQPAPIQPAN